MYNLDFLKWKLDNLYPAFNDSMFLQYLLDMDKHDNRTEKTGEEGAVPSRSAGD